MEIIQYLYEQNPWWVKKGFLPEESFLQRREIFGKISSYLSVKQAIVISGLRRTGKTTLLKQIISELLTKGESAENILFFSFDEAMIERKTDILEEIIRIFVEQIAGKKLWELKEKLYIFLDEVQYIPNWQSIIKRFYDVSGRLKFFLCGSSSLFITRKAKESLAGRVFDFILPPLSFREYLFLKGIDPIPPHYDFGKNNINEIKKFSYAYGLKYRGLFEEYLFTGQFPETALFLDERKAKSYLRTSILEKILSYDIPITFGARNIEEIKTMFRIMVRDTGNMIEYENLARDLHMSRNTVSNYITFFENAFLLKILYNFTKSMRKQLRTGKKVYISSTNFIPAVLGVNRESKFLGEFMGHLVETYAFNILRDYFEPIFFWRQRDKEIDFVVISQEIPTGIEVKYSSSIRDKDIGTLVRFTENAGGKRGYVLSSDITDIRKISSIEIIFLPVWAI